MQEADHRHDGVVEKLLEASEMSHLLPQHKQTPVWGTSAGMGEGGGGGSEREREEIKEKKRNRGSTQPEIWRLEITL